MRTVLNSGVQAEQAIRFENNLNQLYQLTRHQVPRVQIMETFRRMTDAGADPVEASNTVVVLTVNGMTLDRAFRHAQRRAGVAQIGLVSIEALDGRAVPGELRWVRLEKLTIVVIMVVFGAIGFGVFWWVASLSRVAAGCLGAISVLMGAADWLTKIARKMVAEYRQEEANGQ